MKPGTTISGKLLLLFILSFTHSASIFERVYHKSPASPVTSTLHSILHDRHQISALPSLSSFSETSTFLLSAFVTFRHGDRTTGKGAELFHFREINSSKFQVLTPIGARRLGVLGQILYRRYKLLVDSKSLFITSAKNRCLQSLLNFLQGFRDLGISEWTKAELVSRVDSEKFFVDNHFKLLHDCKGPDEQFLEIAGTNYGNVSRKRKEKAPDSSEDQDDLGEFEEQKLGTESSLILESFEDPLHKFLREIRRQNRAKSPPALCANIITKTQKKTEKQITKKPKEKSSYLNILQSMLSQIIYSKFNVFLLVGKSFFSGSKGLTPEKSSYSRLCQNYAMTLKREMWRFHEGETRDIKFCFYNNQHNSSKSSSEESFFFQQGIFVAEKGT